jgi:hypothetical protein
LTVLAYPGFDQIATVVIIAHGYQIPSNDHFSRVQSTVLHVLGGIVELGIGQQGTDLRDRMNVSIQFQDLDTHPAVILICPRVHIEPGPLLVTTNDCQSIPFIKTPFKEIGNPRTITAISLL